MSGAGSGQYEVFHRKNMTEPMVHAGSVEAADPRMALLLAKETFFRREHPIGIWVTRRDDLHPLAETDVLEPGTDKSYRAIEAYTGIAKKREAVEEGLA
ncbi:MAG TPA: 1,2-phenylacetyl-CoA epoxidase subunit B [Chloroflexota bacterium]|nr:1,2-phenylacetyl-CoA epoxidase subunit B [Chloroflexota bacterium]